MPRLKALGLPGKMLAQLRVAKGGAAGPVDFLPAVPGAQERDAGNTHGIFQRKVTLFLGRKQVIRRRGLVKAGMRSCWATSGPSLALEERAPGET